LTNFSDYTETTEVAAIDTNCSHQGAVLM